MNRILRSEILIYNQNPGGSLEEFFLLLPRKLIFIQLAKNVPCMVLKHLRIEYDTLIIY